MGEIVPWVYKNIYSNQKYLESRDYLINNHLLKIKQNLDNEININQNTGNLVWDGAYILSKYLYRLRLKNKKCIELGCGTGLVGITAWTYGADITLTDIEEVIPLVKENVSVNVDKVLSDKTSDNNLELSKDNIRIKTLNWGSENCKDLDKYDIVFGSEILYYSKSHKALIETLQQICNENTLCVFIYKTRNLGEEHFFELAKNEGFTIEFIDNKKLVSEFQESEYHLFYMKKKGF
ncbi:S-adenosyl-L-methionine-dependent methyltransferase [Anaeromyces robustus]|uniref:S-adenosyl-L-methionine-dependent methyltransferase n=1 Tax=Anaeromyces robustus TaxID=1754192 RepID=A0A1Y1X744_9FUNG|nr:S-adenosyl-L-methionine-dependent methyltransferase [Anaeromyces robustus]|eukprot:ORX81589.1 S-adenosyl-L-methionine-dependent methyltransferase [Anaeromyces robustus]